MGNISVKRRLRHNCSKFFRIMKTVSHFYNLFGLLLLIFTVGCNADAGRGDEMAALCESQISLGTLSEALANWCSELQMLQLASENIETLIKLKKAELHDDHRPVSRLRVEQIKRSGDRDRFLRFGRSMRDSESGSVARILNDRRRKWETEHVDGE